MNFSARLVLSFALIVIPWSTALAAANTSSLPAPPPTKQTANTVKSASTPAASKNTLEDKPAVVKPTPEQISAAFAQYTKAEMDKVYATYKGNHYQLLFIKADPLINQADGWVKTVRSISPAYKAAPLKDNPSVGSLEVSTTTSFFEKCPTQQTAAATKSKTRSIVNKHKFDLRYTNGKWTVTGAKDYDSSLSQWFDGEKDIFKTLSCQDEKH